MKLFGTRRRLAAAESEVARLTHAHDTDSRSLADANVRMQLLEAESAALTRDNEILRRVRAAADHECARLRDAYAALCRQNASLLADVEASIPMITAAEGQRDELAEQLAVAEGRLTRLVRPREANAPAAEQCELAAVAP
ncbi:hypothetical protein B4N89_27300 [Embleya scabrispora]|uniref:Uncharacterized protein n=1 Tax=Embleya scabrispora TaxID=159449 RepID=A0A1T3P4W4_9ACTN|nr:hypothetical protein [Embleya scabrispora]OPC84138.1 hypothetical protein B4N89_27300 [Embleya scabrispora]